MLELSVTPSVGFSSPTGHFKPLKTPHLTDSALVMVIVVPNPCQDRTGPPGCRPGGPPRIPLRAYLSAREIREPDFEATHPTAHPLSFLVDCPTGDSLPTWRCLAQMYGGTTFGPRPYTTFLRAPNPLGNPRFVANRAVVRATSACELDRKTTVPAHTAAEDRRNCRMHAKQIAPRTFFGLEPPIESNQHLLNQLC